MSKPRDAPVSLRIARMLRELEGPMIEKVRKAPEPAARLSSDKSPDTRKRRLRRTLANLETVTRNGR